jgi:cardiolipin synthase C
MLKLLSFFHQMNKIRYYFLFLILFSCAKKQADQVPEQEKDFCKNIHINKDGSLSKSLVGLTDLMLDKTGVHVLEDGGGSLITRAWLCENAEQTIDIQYFIFSIDNVGLIACDYLVRAADRGVKIRILVDDLLIDAGTHEILTLDSHENISIKIYNPGVNLGKNIYNKTKKFLNHFRNANQRMHNKTFTVDGQVAITGGRNIADEYFDYDHEYNFRDRDVLLLGKTARKIQTTFNDFWNSPLSVPITDLLAESKTNFHDSTRFGRLHQYACNPANFWPQIRERIQKLPTFFEKMKESGNLVWVDSVDFVTDIPGKNSEKSGLKGGGNSTTALTNLVKNAKKSIIIQSPYLITTEVGQNLFASAIKRGVSVKILTNSLGSTDNLEAFSGYQRDRKKLLQSGVKIFEFRPDAAIRKKIMTGALQEKMNYTPIFGLHAKSMVIDDEITVIGTFNLDPRSANLNTECVTIIKNKQITKEVKTGMELELAPENAWETTLKWNPDGEVELKKRIKTFTKKVIPKSIL